MAPPLRLKPLVLLPLLLVLGACSAVVLDPAGDVAGQQRDLLVVSTLLMLLIIVPVMALVVVFAWRYRASNKSAAYEPDWDHSTHLELVIWAAPLLIIICLGALTWAGTHLLDPYRPLSRIKAGQATHEAVQPLEVQVVALDWKWLFIYPQYGIATVNELAAPVDRPISFSITASSVMNSFYIPAMAGQIYAMPGMQTRLHGVINKAGDYQGFSANYSGDGFSHMKFAFKGLDEAGFESWVARAKANPVLDRRVYLDLEKPSENAPVMRFAAVEPGLWDAIVGMCVEPGKMCMSEMMALDRRGGLGLKAARNTAPLTYDKYARRGAAAFGSNDAYVLAICTPEEAAQLAAADRPQAQKLRPPPYTDPLRGAGLTPLSPFSTSAPLAGRDVSSPRS